MGVGDLSKSTQEVGYDDGSLENATSVWAEKAGSEIAAKFELNSYPARIQSVKFFIPEQGKYDQNFQVLIYDSNGLKGSPGNEFLNDRIVARATRGNEWVTVDLSKLGLAIQDHFFVSMRWLTAPGKDGKSAQFIGCDTSNPKENTWVKMPAGRWLKIKDFGKSGDRTAMIRVVLFLQQASTSMAESPASTALDLLVAEIKYDSGNPRGNTIPLSDSPGGEIAVRFTPPWYPAKIQAVRFYITSWGKPNTPFGVRIYAADKGTLPGTRLDDAALRGAGTKGNEWVDVDVSNQDIIIKGIDLKVAIMVLYILIKMVI
jgi:hypothetical protein